MDFLESIADEYTNVPVLLYAARGPGSLMDPLSQKYRVSRKLHDAVSFSRLSSLCKLIVPVGLPSLSRSKIYCVDLVSSNCFVVHALALNIMILELFSEVWFHLINQNKISISFFRLFS